MKSKYGNFTIVGWALRSSVFGTYNHQGFSPNLAIYSYCHWHFWFSSGDYIFVFVWQVTKNSKLKNSIRAWDEFSTVTRISIKVW